MAIYFADCFNRIFFAILKKIPTEERKVDFAMTFVALHSLLT